MTDRQTTKYPGIYYRDRLKGRVYEISYTDSTGKRVFKTVPGGLRDAQRARAQILERMHRGELVAPSKIKVSECVDRYMKSAQHLRPKTRVVYESAANAQVKPRVGDLKISDLSRRKVANMVAEMTEEGLSPWTVRGALTVLSGACFYALEEGWIGVNPVHQLDRRQMPSGSRTQMKILQPEEIGQLLRHSEGIYRTLFRFLIFTGLRIGEALALTWEDIDFDLGEVKVNRSKTYAGVRTVVLPEFLLQDLARLPDHEGLVFGFDSQGNPLYQRSVQKYFKGFLKRANLPDMRVHDLRHTFASLLIAQGEDVVYVASQMGHSNPSTTLRVYAKLFDGDKRKVAAREKMHQRFEEVGS